MLQNPGGNYFQLEVCIFKLLINYEDRIKTLEDMHGKCIEILLVFQEARRNKPTKRRMGSRKHIVPSDKIIFKIMKGNLRIITRIEQRSPPRNK